MVHAAITGTTGREENEAAVAGELNSGGGEEKLPSGTEILVR